MDHLKPIRPPQEWTVDFKVTFKSDLIGFPMRRSTNAVSETIYE